MHTQDQKTLGQGLQAAISPSDPGPETVWVEGQQYSILWGQDNTAPAVATGWTKFKIDFMTGDNFNQKFLTNVATNIDGRTTQSINWTCPQVNPPAKIYFFMFTADDGKAKAWTTRFLITRPDGTYDQPAHATQSDGSKIPWGNGALATSAVPTGVAQAQSVEPASTDLAVSATPVPVASVLSDSSVHSSANRLVTRASLGLLGIAAVFFTAT